MLVIRKYLILYQTATSFRTVIKYFYQNNRSNRDVYRTVTLLSLCGCTVKVYSGNISACSLEPGNQVAGLFCHNNFVSRGELPRAGITVSPCTSISHQRRSTAADRIQPQRVRPPVRLADLCEPGTAGCCQCRTKRTAAVAGTARLFRLCRDQGGLQRSFSRLPALRRRKLVLPVHQWTLQRALFLLPHGTR